MIAAIFDFDGTLYNGHIWQALKRHHETQRVKRLALYRYMWSHIAVWPLYRWGLLSQARFYELWAGHMPWLIRGLTLQEADRVFQWVTEEEVMPKLRQDVLAALREHQAQGHRVILLSGTMQPLLRMIGQRLDVEDVVGTEPVARDGRYTGAIIPPVCMAQGKAERLQAFISACDDEIDLPASYAYADGLMDMAVMELVGYPTAVYPDPRLAAIAEERGWQILGEVTEE